MTSEDYAYWCGRLAQALRAVVDHPTDVDLRLLARSTLVAYNAGLDLPDTTGEVVYIEGVRTVIPS